MPQTLWNVKRDANVTFGHDAVDKRPKHAQMVAKVVALSTELDFAEIGVLARILGDKAHPAAAMYLTLKASSVKAAAMKAIADVTLSAKDAELFSSVQKVCNDACSDRNRFCHWHWAYSADLPDALLFEEPSARRTHMVDMDAARREFAESGDTTRITALKHDPKKIRVIRVYTLVDLGEGVLALEYAISYMVRLGWALDSKLGQIAQKQYDELAAVPSIEKARKAIRKSSPNTL